MKQQRPRREAPSARRDTEFPARLARDPSVRHGTPVNQPERSTEETAAVRCHGGLHTIPADPREEITMSSIDISTPASHEAA